MWCLERGSLQMISLVQTPAGLAAGPGFEELCHPREKALRMPLLGLHDPSVISLSHGVRSNGLGSRAAICHLSWEPQEPHSVLSVRCAS